ncbi:hypothetical protein TRICI_005481 [Trichomonascus ciferrii]|uniref:Uncharacterized protein n=1 Tax=Trichomonascus ciferrii TaxID=44093 RepID=A0A642US86_9ASCO|nr:hypothetical protein TRICI_005481 [Trichomonascus ciferrii]
MFSLDCRYLQALISLEPDSPLQNPNPEVVFGGTPPDPVGSPKAGWPSHIFLLDDAGHTGCRELTPLFDEASQS